jgi:hypothetical protein
MWKKQEQQPVYSPTSQTGLSEGQDEFSTVEAKLVSKFLYDNLETRIKERQ